MAKEHFPELYFILEMIAKSGNDAISVEIAGLSCTLPGEDLRSQAQKAMEMLDAYKEPELPFKGITSEQIIREQQYMNDRYGFVVWSNRMAGTDEDCADRVENDPDYFLGMSEDEVRQISYDACTEDRDFLKDEFDSIQVNGILIYGTIGRWDGAKPGFKTVKTLRDIFGIFTGDDCTLYIKDGELRAENCHHDGTDCFTIRTFKEGVDPEKFCYIDAVQLDTESLVPMLNKHFGWRQFLEEKEESEKDNGTSN